MTKDEAGAFFMSMGCSHFHMAREYPDRYEEYWALRISKEDEAHWRRESFFNLYRQFTSPSQAGANASLFPKLSDLSDRSEPISYAIFSRMADLAENAKSRELYELTLHAAEIALTVIKAEDYVMIAEDIISREPLERRSGLIFSCFDEGYPDLSQAFYNLALMICEQAYDTLKVATPYRSFSRISTAKSRCLSIGERLGFA